MYATDRDKRCIWKWDLSVKGIDCRWANMPGQDVALMTCSETQGWAAIRVAQESTPSDSPPMVSCWTDTVMLLPEFSEHIPRGVFAYCDNMLTIAAKVHICTCHGIPFSTL